MPIAWAGVKTGMPRRGKTRIRKGVSIEVPLIPVSIAKEAMTIHAGNMNQ